MLACLRFDAPEGNSHVVGEVPGAKGHTLWQAPNTGHPGGLSTVHGNSDSGDPKNWNEWEIFGKGKRLGNHILNVV
jgi:Flp pilus assembly CpaF family ATPase